MKILLGSLLFGTAIFINFPELNSLPQPSSGEGPSHYNLDVENIQPEPIVSRRTYIWLYEQEIEVDLARIDNRYEAVNCKVIRPRYSLPTKDNKSTINFMTQADFQQVPGGTFIRIVIYIQENDSKVRNLLGAKLPPPGRDEFQRGDPRNLDPDHTQWFITYKGIDYVVKVEPYSQNLEDIHLYNRRNNRPNEQRIKDHWHEQNHINFGGVHFVVFKTQKGTVVGVALDPFWLHRPGEDFAGVDPHVEPHIRPQRYNSVDPHPVSEETFDQQHYLEQYHLLDLQHDFAPNHHTYQQQNLYQHPNPYAHQFLHPNQIPYNPHFDPTQHNQQQGGSQSPRFHLNENGHYQPYPPTNH